MNASRPPRRSRILFLDDDPLRAAAFLAVHPQAHWVQTAEDCLACLSEPWDEIHLDHDLGRETYVDPDRDDCGMAVVRRLASLSSPHLKQARFVVHSRNANAACMMTLHLEALGYRVEARPFGCDAPGSGSGPAGRRKAWWGKAKAAFRGLLGTRGPGGSDESDVLPATSGRTPRPSDRRRP